MKNTLKSAKANSKTTAVPQPKTTPQAAQSRAGDDPEFPSPCIVLFPEGDGGVSEEIIDLSKAEYTALKRAAAPAGDGVLMFTANAALEKIGFPAAQDPLKHPSASAARSRLTCAANVLIDFAVRKVQGWPIDEQICVWKALSIILSDSAAREYAGRIARLQSEVAACQLQFSDTLSRQPAQPSRQRRAA